MGPGRKRRQWTKTINKKDQRDISLDKLGNGHGVLISDSGLVVFSNLVESVESSNMHSLGNLGLLLDHQGSCNLESPGIF